MRNLRNHPEIQKKSQIFLSKFVVWISFQNFVLNLVFDFFCSNCCDFFGGEFFVPILCDFVVVGIFGNCLLFNLEMTPSPHPPLEFF